MSSPSTDPLASFLVLPHRLQISLADPSLLPPLQRSQWQCLVSSCASVLQILSRLLQHARSSLLSSDYQSLCTKLYQPLRGVHIAVKEAEACLEESLPDGCRSTHSWLVRTALPQSMSTHVVDNHLHRLMYTFSVACQQILRSAPPSFHGEVFSRICELTGRLCSIWACVDTQADFCGAQSLLIQIKCEEKEEACQLADFLLQKLSCHESLKRITHDDALPPCLWIDSKALKRINTLGEGGYGKVNEALWLGGRFAVKDFFYVENNEVFGREASIQAQLRHPNVLPLVCCSRTPSLDKCSLVMELMERDLRMLIMQNMLATGGRPFSLTVAVDLMLQIARGMEYLHSDSLRIMHRDLKSSNILVSSSRQSPLHHVKVADFGMSKAKYESSTYTTRPVGTLNWRAPEVFQANPGDEDYLQPNAKYTKKADVYSFALICYEILTGELPFEGSQIRRRILAGERPKLPSDCPPALASYIQTCWHAEPERRPAFTHICRMLRYFKACIDLLPDQQQQDNHKAAIMDSLSHPVSPAMFARIDEMQRSVVQKFDCDPQIKPVVLIPLEMYCCGQIVESTAADVDGVSSIRQSNGVDPEQSKRIRKGFLDRALGLLKRLSCCQACERHISEFEDAVHNMESTMQSEFHS